MPGINPVGASPLGYPGELNSRQISEARNNYWRECQYRNGYNKQKVVKAQIIESRKTQRESGRKGRPAAQILKEPNTKSQKRDNLKMI